MCNFKSFNKSEIAQNVTLCATLNISPKVNNREFTETLFSNKKFGDGQYRSGQIGVFVR